MWRPSTSRTLDGLAAAHGVPLTRLGETGGPRMAFDGLFETTVAELRAIHDAAIPRLLGEAV